MRKGKAREQPSPSSKHAWDPEALEAAVRELDANADYDLFEDLPLCSQTLEGIRNASFTKMTPIQARSLGFALKGRDILGAARTGSGKTLAFLIPILELLYRRKWSHMDGLGALIISPTRELAIQTFDVLRKIGGKHSFSAGLVIGGKSLKDEQERLSRMNILIATPGRLLQHMDQTYGFSADELQILVLDEADRCLDLGFAKCLDAILANLPPQRQTLLFSATQTKSINDLARLSLRNPEYIAPRSSLEPSVSNGESSSTVDVPAKLEQFYMVVPLEQKIDRLWSFIKVHLQSKLIVFASSSKQVRFMFESMRHMRPGIPLMHLFGRQKQGTRIDTYTRFSNSKHAVLFATDVAARGLDFPAVDWVIQLDCPEDSATYVHRVGRTARYNRKGKALLFLCPSEEDGMIKQLSARGITVSSIKAKESKLQSIQGLLQSYAFQYPEIKNLAQRAFISYVRSVYLQGDKSIFKLEELPLEAYASSLGLAGAPQIRFPSKEATSKRKNASRDLKALASGSDSDDPGEDLADSVFDGRARQPLPSQSKMMQAAQTDPQGTKTKYERMFKRKNQSVLAPHFTDLVNRTTEQQDGATSDGGGEEDLLTLTRRDHDLDLDALPESSHISKRKLRQGQSKKAMAALRGSGTKIVFDQETGEANHLHAFAPETSFAAAGPAAAQSQQFFDQERSVLKEADAADKAVAKQKKREKKRKRKERERGLDMEGDADQEGAVVEPLEDDSGYISPDFDLDSGPGDRMTDQPPRSRAIPHSKRAKRSREDDLDDLEGLAMQVLSRGRTQV